MKGISTIIATILLVVITITLVGTSYMFMGGMMGSTTGEVFEIIDISDEKVLVRNLGTDTIKSFNSIMDNRRIDNEIEEGSISPNSMGSVILLGIDPGNHDLLLASKSMSQTWKWKYFSDYVIVDFDNFESEEDWGGESGNWGANNGEYQQSETTGETYSNKDAGVNVGVFYEMEFMFTSSRIVFFTVASNGTPRSGVCTEFDKDNEEIRLMDINQGVWKTKTSFPFSDVWYKVRVEIESDRNYKLYVNGQHIPELDYTIPSGSIFNDNITQFGTIDSTASFDKFKLGKNSSEVTTTTTTSTTSTSTSTTTTTTSTTTIPSGPLGFWKFDEGNGTTTYDSSTNGNDGVFYGESFYDGTFGNGIAGTEPTRKSGADCKYGNCLEFEGTPDVIADVVNVSDIPNTSLTIMAWIYPKQIWGDQRVIVSKWDGGDINSEWLFRLNNKTPPNPASLQFYTRTSGGWPSKQSGNVIQPYEWAHVAAVYNRETGYVDFYKNGTLLSGGGFVNFTTDRSAIVRIGAQGAPSYDPFNGTIDEVRIFDRALTQTEIQAEMNSSLPVERPVASWSFEEGSGQYANDTHIWVNGTYGSALSFDEINDYVGIPGSSSLDITDELTFSAWVYPLQSQSSGGSNQIITKFDWGDQTGFFLREGSTQNHIPQFWVGNDSSWHSVSAGYTNPDRWYHIAGTVKSNDKIKIYIDGNLEDEKDFIGNMVQSTVELKIGYETTTKNFHGIIDEVKIWNRTLTQTEIQADM